MVEVNDRIKIWKPHPKQLEFLRIPDSIHEGFFGGAAGPGKSEVIVMLPMAREWYKHPRFKGIIFRRTFTELENSLIPRSKDWYPLFGGVYNETKHKWTFPSGATITFSYMERDDDARSHDTAEYHYVGWDELTHFSKFQYEYIVNSRIRTTVKELPAISRAASNPGNIGHKWVKDRFIPPEAKEGGKVLIDSHGLKRIFIFATAKDNPTLLESNPDYLKKLDALPEAERRAKLYGDWDAFAGQMFTEFRDVYEDTKWSFEQHLPAYHLCRPFDIPTWWPKVVTIDWGYAHKNAVHWLAIRPDGKIYVYREFMTRKTKIRNWAPDMVRFSQFDENIVDFVIDPSSKQDRGLDKTIKDQVEEMSGWSFVDADNDRIGGIHLIHEALRFEQKPKSYIPQEGFNEEKAQRIYRMYGDEAYAKYLKLFEEEPPEKVLPKLAIFDTCTDLRNTLPLAVYAEPTPGNLVKAEDYQKFDGDDSIDNLRYGLKAVDHYLYGLEKEQEERAKLGRIIEQYDQTGDYHNFHMAMLMHEERNPKVVSISRPNIRAHGRLFGR